MTALLLDASVWLAALDTDDAEHAAAQAILRAAERDGLALAALDLTLYEVANVATVRWRAPQDARRLAELIAAACPDTLERVDPRTLAAAAKLAAERGLTVYDAAYVEAARRRGWTLVSCDLRDLVRPGHALAPGAASSSRAEHGHLPRASPRDHP